MADLELVRRARQGGRDGGRVVVFTSFYPETSSANRARADALLATLTLE